jgi:hypothetical protein
MNKEIENSSFNSIQLAVTGTELDIKNSHRSYADFNIYKISIAQCELKRVFRMENLYCGLRNGGMSELSVVIMKRN